LHCYNIRRRTEFNGDLRVLHPVIPLHQCDLPLLWRQSIDDLHDLLKRLARNIRRDRLLLGVGRRRRVLPVEFRQQFAELLVSPAALLASRLTVVRSQARCCSSVRSRTVAHARVAAMKVSWRRSSAAA
jgi:hypothetical protein